MKIKSEKMPGYGFLLAIVVFSVAECYVGSETDPTGCPRAFQVCTSTGWIVFSPLFQGTKYMGRSGRWADNVMMDFAPKADIR